MERQTLDKLEAAFVAVEKDLSGRVAELAAKSTSGTLSQEEQDEYEQIVRLNDLLSILKLQAEEYWAPRIASETWRSRGTRGYDVELRAPVNTVDCRREPPFFRIRSTTSSPSSTWARMQRVICACVACAVTSRKVPTLHRRTLKSRVNIVSWPYFTLGSSAGRSTFICGKMGA
jgi:hypothetical protein